MSHQYIYVMKGLSKLINEQEVLKETWLSFIPGAKIGIIGPNGSGKSTLLKIMAGIDRAFHGEAWVAEGTRIGYLAQEPPLDTSKTVGENILDGLKYKTNILQKFNDISARLAEDLTEAAMCSLLEEQAELQEKIELLDAWNLDREIDIAMAALKCPPKDALVNQISGGEKRRVALCKLLLERPDMLLLDEPTNHLDAESVSWLENYLHTYKGTVVSITHDRYFLDNVAQWILEIDRGYCTPWHCNYSKWLELKEKKLSTEEKQESHRIKYLKRELEWIRQSPKARQSKNKARINSYHELLNKQDIDKKVGPAQIVIPNGPRLGDLVIEGDNISKTFQSKVLFKDFNFKIPPGAIVGIIGPNGSGKSTLLNIIAGKEQVDSGEVKIGPTVKLGYVDQLREQLDANKTVWEDISGGLDEIYLGNSIVKSRAYCTAFNFRGTDQQKKVGKLSGGERNRVNMAKLLREGANVILLDEPSNDLDVETLRSLEEAILDFAGCIIVVTHDRWFLDRITTHIIAFDNYGVTYIEGNYSDYCEYITKTQGVDGTTKYKHKKFM